ncbi:unnamed protein product [Aureobasidium pullulans]|nr:unnamed protein product [Aureobasidium pullulans]
MSSSTNGMTFVQRMAARRAAEGRDASAPVVRMPGKTGHAASSAAPASVAPESAAFNSATSNPTASN